MHWRRPVFFWYLHTDGEVTLALLVNWYRTMGVHKRQRTTPKVGTGHRREPSSERHALTFRGVSRPPERSAQPNT